MDLTEKEALEKSFELWVWLYQNPGKRKEDSPYREDLENRLNECWLCITYDLCYNCPGGCGNGGYDGCFGGAFTYWFDRTYTKIEDYTYDPYGAKIAAAYIAAKIRRKLGEYNRWI